MKLNQLAVLMVVVLAGPTRAGSVEQDICQPYVQVNVGNSFGSGTVLNVGGQVLVLTAAHVVEDAVRETRSHWLDERGVVHERVERKYQPVTLVKKSSRGRREWQAEIVRYSPPEEQGGHDLALLRPMEKSGLVPAHFNASTRLEVGMDCWYIGTPRGLHASLEKTILNKLDHEEEQLPGQRYYVVNGHGTYGNSGGGVFVKVGAEYRLVGVVCRIAGWPEAGPKHCLACQRLETVAEFLRLGE
ncbi:MAG: serine protease [Gemmataceae bacterium]